VLSHIHDTDCPCGSQPYHRQSGVRMSHNSSLFAIKHSISPFCELILSFPQILKIFTRLTNCTDYCKIEIENAERISYVRV
jgi:hypothetical protein